MKMNQLKHKKMSNEHTYQELQRIGNLMAFSRKHCLESNSNVPVFKNFIDTNVFLRNKYKKYCPSRKKSIISTLYTYENDELSSTKIHTNMNEEYSILTVVCVDNFTGKTNILTSIVHIHAILKQP